MLRQQACPEHALSSGLEMLQESTWHTNGDLPSVGVVHCTTIPQSVHASISPSVQFQFTLSACMRVIVMVCDCVCVCVCVCVHVCVYVCMCVCKYVHLLPCMLAAIYLLYKYTLKTMCYYRRSWCFRIMWILLKTLRLNVLATVDHLCLLCFLTSFRWTNKMVMVSYHEECMQCVGLVMGCTSQLTPNWLNYRA